MKICRDARRQILDDLSEMHEEQEAGRSDFNRILLQLDKESFENGYTAEQMFNRARELCQNAGIINDVEGDLTMYREHWLVCEFLDYDLFATEEQHYEDSIGFAQSLVS